MPRGPGKYDTQCVNTLIALNADAVILIVVNGDLGSGFSMNATSPAILRRTPEMLRRVADEIEASL